MFELEDTSSADHSDSCSEENELQEDRLFDIPIDNCVVKSNDVSVVTVGKLNYQRILVARKIYKKTLIAIL